MKFILLYYSLMFSMKNILKDKIIVCTSEMLNSVLMFNLMILY